MHTHTHTHTHTHHRYPDYEFISDNEVSKTAGTMNKRYSEVGLFGVILDVLILAECDYIVCTLSSQVPRANSLRQTEIHINLCFL